MSMAGDYLRRAAAEFVGVFALVFVGAGAILYAQSLTDIGLAYGLVVAVMMSGVAHISGGHFNPAVTLGHLVTRRIGAAYAVVYWVTQFVASIAAAALLAWVLPADAETRINLGAPKLSQVGPGPGVVIEAVLTFFLVWVFFATAVDPRGTFRQIAGLAVGFTITLDVLMGGVLTGGMMNPARALGPELIGNHWQDAWVWYLGPFAGGAVAAVCYELLYLRPPKPGAVDLPEVDLDEPRPGDTASS